MPNEFEWEGIETEYRGVNSSSKGDELRWLVNRERIKNKQTGKVVTRAVIRHPGIAVIVPFLSDHEILLMRQYRYSINAELWELPAGTIDGHEENNRMLPDESPETCAARELLEETGYQATKVKKVAECYAMPGSSDELMHVFFTYELKKHEQSLDEGEVISEIRTFTLSEVEKLISQGEIQDAKTLIGLFYALRQSKNDQIVMG